MNKNVNIKSIIIDKPLRLDCGQTINNFPLAYETYGALNEKKDNAILVFHALTGDQFVSGINPITKKDGWWSYAVGPNKTIDTSKYFIDDWIFVLSYCNLFKGVTMPECLPIFGLIKDYLQHMLFDFFLVVVTKEHYICIIYFML